MSDFKQLALLGEGAFSAVYKVQRFADGEEYALKKVKLPSLNEKEKLNALNEIRLLASVRHENIISYKEAFFDDKTRCLCIVTECADSGDLMNQIVKCQKDKTRINEADVWTYLIGMCDGIRELHSMRILHRDLKSANIFLAKSKGRVIAKLGDFNVSTVAKRGLCMTQTGTPYYASPEVWRDMPYDGKSDIWSLGCVLYEACALHPPFQAKDMEGLYRKVLRGQYPRIPTHYSQELSDVISAMLQVNPRHRPTAEQLLQSPPVRSRASELGVAVESEPETPSNLLGTIKVPRNVTDMSPYLPLPQYDDESRRSSSKQNEPESEAAFAPRPALASARSHRSCVGPAEDSGGERRSRRRSSSNRRRASSQPPKPPKRGPEAPPPLPPPPRDPIDSRLPALSGKDASRPGIGSIAAPAVPRLPRILSSPHRLPVAPVVA